MLEGFAPQRDIQKLEERAARNYTGDVSHLGRNNLRTGARAATSAKRVPDCSPESASASGLEVITPLYSPASPGIPCPVWDSPSTREMLTNRNEFTWLGAGAHNVRGKTEDTGRGDSGGFSATSYIKGAYRGDRASFPQRYTAEGQDATITHCSEGNLDERHGKKIFTLGESVVSPSLEICRTCWRQL